MLRISRLKTFLKTSACFTGQFQNVKRCFVLQILLKKQMTSLQEHCFLLLWLLCFAPFSSDQFIRLFHLWIAIFTKIFRHIFLN